MHVHADANQDTAPLCAAADPMPRAPAFAAPDGACDCHVRVFGTASKLTKTRTYTPQPSSFASYLAMMRAIGVGPRVIVQPSVYGTDNRETLKAVARGGKSFRAVVVVNQDVGRDELQRLHAQGARGARVNVLFKSDARTENLQQLARALADFGWHLQMLANIAEIANLVDFVDALAVPVVFDHLGHGPAALGVEHPGIQALLRLIVDGRAWVKLSGAYRITSQPHPPYSDVAPLARALVAANPDRLVWGSDWPHAMMPVPVPNDGDLFDLLPDWAGNAANLRKILVENPEELYGFDKFGATDVA